MRFPDHSANLDDIDVPVGRFSNDWRLIATNLALRKLLGYTQKQLTSKRFPGLISTACIPQWRDCHKQLLTGGSTRAHFIADLRRADGTLLPARLRLSAARGGGSPPESVFVAIEDLTEVRRARSALEKVEAARRAVAKALIDGQEKQRASIARELHDDIGPSLLVLGASLQRAGQQIRGRGNKQHPGTQELCQQLSDIARRVGRLSHQMHSSALQYLGLSAAVQSVCREVSEQVSRRVSCRCRNIPEQMDSERALAALRIVQEALHNAAKHSGARSIQVKVSGEAACVHLSVADDGTGFDVADARRLSGLGLTSMRERAHLLGGRLEIRSRRGKGTVVSARIPLADMAPTDATASSQ